MSSADGVEAFLAAKWKSKKIEMENGSGEGEHIENEQKIGDDRQVSSSKPRTRTPENQRNAPLENTENPSAKYRQSQKERSTVLNNQDNNFTEEMIDAEDEVATWSAKTSEPLKISVENSISSISEAGFERMKSNEEHDNGFMKKVHPFEPKRIPCDPNDEDDRKITEMKNVSGDKVSKYEMTGDVWGLLEQPNEDNEHEEEPAQTAKKERARETVDIVFGALNSDDVYRMSNLGRPNKDQESVVPKMAIPFSNFGRLLEQSRDDMMGDELISKRIYDEGLLRNSDRHFSPTREANGSTKWAAYDKENVDNVNGKNTVYTKPGLGLARPLTSPPFLGFGSPSTEPDSTTRQGYPQYDGDYHLLTNHGERTQSTIIEANLNQRLLPYRTPRQNHGLYHALESRNLTLSSTYDPKLGPYGDTREGLPTNPDTNSMLPISKFKVRVDPLAKTITYNVVKYFQNRKRLFNMPYDEVLVASEATGMSKKSINKILAEGHESIRQNIKPVFSEWKNQKIPKKKFLEPNVKRDCIARMFIHNSYLIKKEVPTPKNLTKNFQENGFETEDSVFGVRTHLKKLGFEFNARSGNQIFLIEQPDYIAQRIRYLEQMQEHRAQKRNIVYVFIADMLKKGITSVEWEGWDGVFLESEQGVDITCVSVLHAASTSYVYHDCLQVIEYEVNSRTDASLKPFSDWLTTKLLPAAPKGSVIVLGDRRFHRMVDIEKRPHVGCTKDQITGWLRRHNVKFDHSWPKAVLLEKVQKVVLDQKYVIDDEITSSGYIPLHIPNHHLDLNPLSFIWQDIKDQLDKTPDISNLRQMRIFVTNEFTRRAVKIGKAWTQVEKLEKSYYNIDMHTDEEREELILRYGSGLVPLEPTDTALPSPENGEKSDEEPPMKTAKMINYS